MSKLSTVSYQKLYEELVTTKEWLNLKRIRTKDTRFEKILNNVKEINEHFKNNTLETLIKKKGNEILWFSLLEANAFTLIYESFKNLKDHEIPRKKFRSIVYGPFLPRGEEVGGNNVNNRNFLFELELAAKLKSKGIKISGFDDIKFEYDSVDFIIECKRIFSKKRIEDNIEKASEQLTKKINKKDAKGIIALSIEKILKTDQSIIKIEHENEINRIVRNTLNNFIANNEKYWKKIIDIRILGIFIILKYIVEIKSKNHLLASGFQIDIIPLCSRETLQFKDYDLFTQLAKELYPKQ